MDKKNVRIINSIFSYILKNELPRFYLAGIIGFILGFVLLYVFKDLIGIWYLSASVYTDIFCYIFGFFMKKFFVFKKREFKNTFRQIFLFIIVTILYIITDACFMYILVSGINIDPYISKGFVAAMMSIISYFLNKKITFSR